MKSYVTVEQKVCPICREKHDSGSLLLDRRLRESFEHYTTTGFDICEACNKMSEDGFVALVGADGPTQDGKLKPQDAVYAAEYLWLKRYVADQIFDVPLGTHPFVYLEPAAIERVKEIVAANIKENDDE